MPQMTRDTWHATHGMWYVTLDTLTPRGVNILLRFQLPSSYGLWFMIFCRFGGKWLSDLSFSSQSSKHNTQTVKARRLNFFLSVTFHHLSRTTFFLCFLRTKRWSYSIEGLLSTGGLPRLVSPNIGKRDRDWQKTWTLQTLGISLGSTFNNIFRKENL